MKTFLLSLLLVVFFPFALILIPAIFPEDCEKAKNNNL
jgi:hypothetical protein